MEGRTVCALVDAAAWPVRWGIKRFRDEFEAKCKATSFQGADLATAGDGASGTPALVDGDKTLTPGGTP